MKVGDWVFVTPDDYDMGRGGLPHEQFIGRITGKQRDGWVHVKPLFFSSPFETKEGEPLDYSFYESQCVPIVRQNDDSQSNPA